MTRRYVTGIAAGSVAAVLIAAIGVLGSDAVHTALGAGATGKAIYKDSTAAAARTELGLGTAAVEDVAAGGSGDLLRADGDGSSLTGITGGVAAGLSGGEIVPNMRHPGNWTPTAGSAPLLVWAFTKANVEALRDSSTPIPDLSGNGYTGTLQTGTARLGSRGGIWGLDLDGSSAIVAPDADALRLDRAVTIMMWIDHPWYKGSTELLFSIRGWNVNGGLDDNSLVYLAINGNHSLRETREYGAGSTDEITDFTTTPARMPYPSILTYRRASDGKAWDVSINKAEFHAVTATNAPEKDAAGNKQRFLLGGLYVDVGYYPTEGWTAGVMVFGSRLTDAQRDEIVEFGLGIETP